MQVPRSWDDVENLVASRIPESHWLEYKEALRSNTELAKDLAAMCLDGGMLIFGIAAGAGQVADHVTPVPLGVTTTTRIEQVASTNVAPPARVEVKELEDPGTPGSGVVVVVVSSSRAAPHMANNRYPTRGGTATRYMDEPEVARLYERRRTDIAAAIEGALDSGSAQFGAGASGIGKLGVAIQSSAHEDDLPQGRAVAAALRAARDRALEKHRAGLQAAGDWSHLLQGIGDWAPHGVVGWSCGMTQSAQDVLTANAAMSYSMLYTHEGRLSLALLWNLTIQDENGHPLGMRCAREFVPAVELAATAAFAGEFFAEVAGARLTYVGAEITDVDDAASADVSRCRGGLIDASTPRAVSGFRRTLQRQTLEIRDDPAGTAVDLLDRWLLPLVADPSTYVRRLWSPT